MRIGTIALVLIASAARADGLRPMTSDGGGAFADVAFAGVLVRIDEDPASGEARGRRAQTPIEARTRTEDACPEAVLPIDASPALGCVAIVVTDGGVRQRASVRIAGAAAAQGDDDCVSWCSEHPGRVAIELDVDRSPPWSYEEGASQIARTETFVEPRGVIVFPGVVSFAQVELRGRRPWRTSKTITPPPPPPTGITLVDRHYGICTLPIRPPEPERLTFAVEERWRGVTTETVEVSGWDSTEWIVGDHYVVVGRRDAPVPLADEIWHVGIESRLLDELRARFAR